jgi:two-component system NarL family sensor kinase
VTEAAREQGREVDGMSRRTAASWLAWSVCAVTLLILASSLLLIVLGWSPPLARGWTPWQDQAVSLVGIIGAPILGGLIASRRPENPYGWLWLGFGLGLSLQQLGQPYGAYALVVEPGSLVAPRTIPQLLERGGPLALSFAPFLFLLFPTGWLPSRRWRPRANARKDHLLPYRSRWTICALDRRGNFLGSSAQ